MQPRHFVSFATLSACVLALISLAARPFDVSAAAVTDQDQGSQVRDFTVVGDHYAYSPAVLTVNQGDVVKITFTAKDIPHSFTIDGPYRISKRAAVGQTVTFRFRADAAGAYPIYCNLTQDPKCKDMKGTLKVQAR